MVSSTPLIWRRPFEIFGSSLDEMLSKANERRVSILGGVEAGWRWLWGVRLADLGRCLAGPDEGREDDGIAESEWMERK